jgi:hypothetical protein
MVRFWFFGLRSRRGTYLESIASLNIKPEVLTRFLEVGRFSSDPFTGLRLRLYKARYEHWEQALSVLV